MARQPYVDNNGTWTPVKVIWVNNNGVWKQAQGLWESVNGSYKRTWPPDPINAQLLVVGGGGGGGSYQLSGGGGAGGVIYRSSISLSAINTSYPVIVGAGGSIGQNGQNSSFNATTVFSDTVDQPIYQATYPVYTSFLNAYGVWNTPPPQPTDTITLTYTTLIQITGVYTLTCSADNVVDSITINGGSSVLSESGWNTTASTTLNLSAGVTTITVTATNLDSGSPGSVAAALYNDQGLVVWSTRSPLNNQTESTGIIAIGGGAGGAVLQNGHSGGSGGGGGVAQIGNEGSYNYWSGGQSMPGQGNNGGQGYGQWGDAWSGGGGGGAGSTGQDWTRFTGGAGGSGITVNIGGVTYTVGGGGGGAGSWNGQGGYYAGAGGLGGGGNAGSNGTNGTGGGGGANANGGSGIVSVGYVSATGNPLFTGGDQVIVNRNADYTANIVHVFDNPGSYNLTGLTG